MDEKQVIEYVRNKLPDDVTITAVAEFFKVFGDATPAKIKSCPSVKELFVNQKTEKDVRRNYAEE